MKKPKITVKLVDKASAPLGQIASAQEANAIMAKTETIIAAVQRAMKEAGRKVDERL